jgi:hypothetical protein
MERHALDAPISPPPRHGRTRPEAQAAILEGVLKHLRAVGPAGMAVFDLDSTLLDNRPRQARILREYGVRAGLPALAGTRPEHLTSWDLGAAMRNAGCTPSEVARHLLSARRFWGARFFTSAYCRDDVPVPGAPAFVRQAAEACQVAYVTGRPRDMEAGTVESLRRHGFPAADGRRVHLLMKPGLLGDDEWKARAAVKVAALGPIAACFDNEPAHVNGYALAFPEAVCVHLDTDHSARPIEVLGHIPSVADFRR